MENCNEKIKICFVIDRLSFGGAEKLTIQLINYLDKDKFHKTLIYLNEPKKELSFKDYLKNDIIIKYLDTGQSKLIFRILKLKKLLKNYDIVHSSLETSNLYCSIVNFIFPTRTKFISTIHGIDFPFVDDPYLKQEYSKSSLIDKILYKNLQTFLFRFYYQFIAVCLDIKNYLINIRKINPEKVSVFYHGIDLNEGRQSYNTTKDLKNKYSIKDEDYVIGYAGRMGYGKGLEYFIKEFNTTLKNIPNVKLLLIGDGELYEYLLNYVNENSLTDKVIFTGFQKHIFNFYNLLDLFVIPSFSESTNLTVLEALFSGVTVVSSDAGGLKEIIEDGTNGFLFKTGDFNEMSSKILNVYQNRFHLEKIIENAKNTVINKFDLSKNLPEIQKFILTLKKI